ncbi:MAG: DinB family protein [Caldilineaceae bacterium]
MTNPNELTLFWNYTARSVDHIIDCLDGLNSDQLNWQPCADASSLYMLAVHMMGNMEEVILGLLCGQPVQRDRDAEFAAVGESAEPVRARWAELRRRIESNLLPLGDAMLNQPFTHPRRGPMSGRAILMVVMRHAAEHMGHAELTRQIMRAAF